MTSAGTRRVCVLINPKSGLYWSFTTFRKALEQSWDVAGTDLVYRFCAGVEDGIEKAHRAVVDGSDTVLVVGGDGTVSTVGRALIGTGVNMGVIPVGSGNGFARHFGIPLSPTRAAKALLNAEVKRIDVGIVEKTPFLVTCSMAWDAAIAGSFAKWPVRGIVPYVFAAVHELLEYEPQDMEVEVDGKERLHLSNPLLFTVANLTEYGGGARIAPDARPDDGYLELVVALRQDAHKFIANIHRLFDGSLTKVPEVIYRQFQSLVIRRERPGPIQIDGEYVEAAAELKVEVIPDALGVLVPRK